MVNYTIWYYLENRFGQIPRPESWLAAERAMQQGDLSSEQTAAEETGQEAHDSNIELENSPDGEGDSQDIPDDCAETEAGHPKPEPNVVDARHLELYLLGVEVGTGDSKWLDEGTNMLEAPDKGSQCAGDEVEEDEGLPKLSSEALKTQEALPFITSECTETWTGHQKPEDEVVDMRHVVDVLPMFEVGSTGQAWYGKHAKELQAPDKGDLPKSSSEVVEPEVADVQQVEDHLLEVEAGAVDLIQPEEHANTLEAPDEGWLSSKALEPEGDTTRQAGGHSMEDDRHTRMNGNEPILDIPDPPGTHAELPNPQAESPTLRSECEVTGSMLGDPSEESEGSSQLRETERPEPHRDRTSEGKFRIDEGRYTSDIPPDEARGMGVLSSPGVRCGDGMAVEATATRLEIRNISAQTTQALPNLPHPETHPKEPDKGKISNGYNDTVSRDITTLHSIQRALLIDRGCQHSECEMKRPDDLPALHRLPSNGITDTPRMSH
ncbi:hypothetical protein EDD15DRAFT_2246556 [Pisolithus albus]|nr:hypothetical protein EDD15DRAFT_2246556 [Pisolithus albus]